MLGGPGHRATPLLLTIATVSAQAILQAQSTQSLIAGRLSDDLTREPLAHASVVARNLTTNVEAGTITDTSGSYLLAALPPGTYSVRAKHTGYRSKEVFQLILAVSARLELDFKLLPVSGPAAYGRFAALASGRYLNVFGPDLRMKYPEAVELIRGESARLLSSLSYVVDPMDVQKLPLAGRDSYTLLALQPGVTSDAGTARGFGLSVHGRRPTAASFLLDGLENNNYLITGPLSVVAPEAIQEYRVSTANFSAEYGGTAGYIANAINRMGSAGSHGVIYFNTKNARLNANDFQKNASSIGRTPLKDLQPGFSVGGPLIRGKVFASLAGEYYHFRSREEPQRFRFPTLTDKSSIGPIASSLLNAFRPPGALAPDGTAMLEPTASIDRWYILPRLDSVFGQGKYRIMGRVAAVRVSRPDFVWSPYREFTTPLSQSNQSGALGMISVLSPLLTNEIRSGWNQDDLRIDRRWPSIPTLAAGIDVGETLPPSLPGSAAFYSVRNRNRSWELIDNITVLRGRHVLKAGGGALWRRLQGYITTGRDGAISFENLRGFMNDQPLAANLALVWPVAGAAQRPSFGRQYSITNCFAYAEDSFRLRPRLSVYYGIRYERQSPPVNVGQNKDMLFQFGPGTTIGQRITSLTYRTPSSGHQPLYDADSNDAAIRLGLAAALDSSGSTDIRAAYGMFYDRQYDNLWQTLQTNDVVIGAIPLSQVDYLRPGDLLAQFNSYSARFFPRPTIYQPRLRNGYAQTGFLGIGRRIAQVWTTEVNGVISFGHKLITTDVINRYLSIPPSNRNVLGQFRQDLPALGYRANQGNSGYWGISTVLRYAPSRAKMQVSYTFGHSVDNQSEPLEGEYLNLNYTRLSPGALTSSRSLGGFARQFDSHADYGASDFDQRHNFTGFASLPLPAAAAHGWRGRLSRNWNLAGVWALRSGLPFSVYAQPPSSLQGETIHNNRADLVVPRQVYTDEPVTSGRRLLNGSAFGYPPRGTLGNTKRNQFRGPGFVSVDVSLSRSFVIKALGELTSFTVRADAFNVLNHANLGAPDSNLDSAEFGLAKYGRTGRTASLPLVAPFVETARQIQLLLRVTY